MSKRKKAFKIGDYVRLTKEACQSLSNSPTVKTGVIINIEKRERSPKSKELYDLCRVRLQSGKQTSYDEYWLEIDSVRTNELLLKKALGVENEK